MSDIVITEEQIKEWQEGRVELEETIRDLQAKLDLINRRLEALRLFSVDSNEVLDRGTKALAELTGPTVVLSVLEQAEKPLRAAEVKEAVMETDYPEEKWGKNFAYLYAVLSRLVGSGKLVKHEGYYGFPFEEGTEETS